MPKKKHSQITTTRIIMLGFALGIVLGTLLLALPISHQGELSLSDSLFVATSSICVTGLSTVNIGTTFTLYRQFILLLLIEEVGMGVITFTVLVMLFVGRRLRLTDRLLIQSAYNTNSMTGLIKLTKKILKASLIIQGVGALGYAFVFVRDYGPIGIWYSVFHSVSAYCNAGIDLLGGNSLVQYCGDWLVNLNTMFLIIAGGIGFPVYWEIERAFRKRKNPKLKKVGMECKIVLTSTVALIVLGALFTAIFEWNNPATLGNKPISEKILASFFQSVTLRTAGFATIDQAGFLPASSLVYLLLMLIGGSPAGTAGGIKTVTFVILLATMVSNIRGNKNVNLFRREIGEEYVKNCCAIAMFSLSTLFLLTALLMFVQNYNFLDALYEMTSAVATVGLSRGMTGELGILGKLIVILTMYLGRLGPITIALSFNYKKQNRIRYASDKMIL